MAPAPSNASTSASTSNLSGDFHEARHELEGEGKGGKVDRPTGVAALCTYTLQVTTPRAEDEEGDVILHDNPPGPATPTNNRRISLSTGACPTSPTSPTLRDRGALTPPGNFDSEYELLDQVLGTGASGSVRQAECRRTGRRVAVKSFRVQALPTKALLNLEREVEVHGSIDHPGVVPLEAVFETEETVHIVMEQLKGGELFDKLLATGRYCESDAAKVIVQLLRTVDYLHAHGMMHRDLKPENIMYVDKESDEVKIIDFGFATHFEKGTKLMQRCGTLQYVAPEVLTGHGYDEKADMWSLGSVAYTLLTMKAMYSGDDSEIQRRNKLGAVDFSRTFKMASARAQDFIQSLLCLDPVARLSAEEALRHPWLLQHAPEEVTAALLESEMRRAAEAARPTPWSTHRALPNVSARLDRLLPNDKALAAARMAQANRAAAAKKAVLAAGGGHGSPQKDKPTCFAAAAKLLAPTKAGAEPKSPFSRLGAQLVKALGGAGEDEFVPIKQYI